MGIQWCQVYHVDIISFLTALLAAVGNTTPASAPAAVYVGKSSNLTFNESLYASDTLSDPDGQLRITIDAIDAKYGYLIK